MKNVFFVPNAPLRNLATLLGYSFRHLGVPSFGATKHLFLLCFLIPVLSLDIKAQDGGGGEEGPCVWEANESITCTGFVVNFKGNINANTHIWDFGDGSPNGTGSQIQHLYRNFNTDPNNGGSPIVARYSPFGGNPINWCTLTKTLNFGFTGISIGSGCGTSKTLKSLITSGVMPQNGVSNTTIYIFGDLEVDVPYFFSRLVAMLRIS